MSEVHELLRGDRTPWPHDPDVHAWWASRDALLAGEYPTDVRGTARKVEILAEAGIRTWIDLTTPADGLDPYDRLIEEEGIVREAEMRRVSFPIPDVDVIEPDGYVPIVERIDAEIAEGRPVYVHCWGGIGRTGTVVGCWLVSKGLTGDEALAWIAEGRRGSRKEGRPSPETQRQRDLVRSWVWPGDRAG